MRYLICNKCLIKFINHKDKKSFLAKLSLQICSKIRPFTDNSLGKYELGQFNYNFISRQKLYDAVIIFKHNFVNLTAD